MKSDFDRALWNGYWALRTDAMIDAENWIRSVARADFSGVEFWSRHCEENASDALVLRAAHKRRQQPRKLRRTS